jgi:DNA polymerase-3 subunit gamma/tau
MSYTVLARKYRPQKFSEVVGQEHVTRTLQNAIEQGRTAHGYIFSGHRGIGKTTVARILAAALNCRSKDHPVPEPCGICESCTEIRAGNSVDVIEIDAATNRGIDEIRELREAARYRPARDRFKIYILDEAHQITDAAFNALLKTLEEPPDHIVFMLATTQPEDIPQTIRSRCQHFSFHAVKFDDILAQLKMIANQEEVEAEEGALALLAEAGDGSMRDALSIMDQAIASAPCDAKNRPVLATTQIRELMGSVPNTVFEHLLEAVAAGESAALMTQLNDLLNAGHSPQSLARQMVRYLRNTLMAKLGGDQTELLQISADERARAARSALLFGEEEITRNLQIMLRTFDDLNYRQEQRFHLELGMMKLVHAQRLLPLEELLSGVASGTPVRSGSGSSTPRSVPPASRTHSPAPPAPSVTSTPPPPRSPFGFSSGLPTVQSAAPKVESNIATTAPPEPPPVIDVLSTAPAATAAQISRPPVGYAEPARSEDPDEPDPIEDAPVNDSGSRATAAAAQQAVITALAEAGHASASTLLATARFTLEATSLRIEVPGMGKKMLALTVNAAAEKIIKQEMQRLGGPVRFMVIPGEGITSTSSLSAPPSGSIQQAALEHPMVQRAKELFNAEVRSVVDLRTK